MQPRVFSEAFREQFRELLTWRRDVRKFQPAPLPQGLIEELIDLTRLAPSVGLCEPWRFIRIKSAEKREEIRAEFERSNAEALAGYSGKQAEQYAKLKLAGLDSCPVQLAVFADRATQKGFGLGRRTMPEMLEYSVIGAINTLWLSARAYGIGMGWVSILDPQRVSTILSAPEDWQLIAYLCLGYPEDESTTPELERAGWETRDQKGPVLLEC